MGTLLVQEIPTGQGELIRVETLPLLVEPNAAFEEAKQILDQMVASAGALANSITNDEDYNRGLKMLQALKVFLRNIDEGVDPTKRRINDAKDRLMSLIHELDVPAKQLQQGLAKETGRYLLWKQDQVRLENERKAREAEVERQRLQHESDIRILRAELDDAYKTCTDANGRNQTPTANEIGGAIAKWDRAIKSPATVQNPIAAATEIRQVVALALQHEQARIAAAQAKAEGDKKAAASILRASAKLEAPVVEEVIAEQVHVAPSITRQPDLFKAKGGYVTREWKVKRIYDPTRVPHQFCTPSESLLNEHAKTFNKTQSKPIVPGVEFEELVSTKGVR
jgi:hypothetical protein